jgi:hypothetical protein
MKFLKNSIKITPRKVMTIITKSTIIISTTSPKPPKITMKLQAYKIN